jgi:hypothetical protein
MSGKTPLVFTVCFCGSLLFVALALHNWGAAEIREDFGEVIFLTVGGIVWLAMATKLCAWFGVSLLDDAIERKNDAALVAICGAVLSAAVIYTGGSVGEGPSYLNNVFSFGLAGAGLIVFWILLEIGSSISRSIVEERDLASGIRLAGFLVSISLVLGRAVAGDWHSESGTVRDFIRDGWFAVVIYAVAVPTERFSRPNRQYPFRAWTRHGLIPVSVYLALAWVWLCHLGYGKDTRDDNGANICSQAAGPHQRGKEFFGSRRQQHCSLCVFKGAASGRAGGLQVGPASRRHGNALAISTGDEAERLGAIGVSSRVSQRGSGRSGGGNFPAAGIARASWTAAEVAASVGRGRAIHPCRRQRGAL